LSSFRYANGNLPGRSDKPTRASCDRCGQTWKLHELRWESIGAKGSPDDRRSGLRVCPDCFDPIHPLSKRPLVIRQVLPDAIAMYQPREDPYDFIIAYPVFFTLPGAIFKPNPLSVLHGTLALNLIANGIFVGPQCTAIGDSFITLSNIQYINEQTVTLTMGVSFTTPLGIDNNLYIVDGAGNKLRAQINVS
jgi:hypothetical protein